jgi:hypothetical protein
MGVLKPSGDGLYLFQHSTAIGRLPSIDIHALVDSEVAMTPQCDYVLWHRRFGHLNMQSLHAQRANGVHASPALPSYVKKAFCD